MSPKSPGYLRMSHLPASYWTGLSDLLRGRFDAVRHVRSIKTPLDQTHVYSIESEDRLATFAVTRFLYRTIGDGRNIYHDFFQCFIKASLQNFQINYRNLVGYFQFLSN